MTESTSVLPKGVYFMTQSFVFADPADDNKGESGNSNVTVCDMKAISYNTSSSDLACIYARCTRVRK